MPFGLRNAAQPFQRFIDQVLQGLECCYAYIDDLLIASPTPEDHKQHLRSVLKRLSNHSILINPAKCVWGATELQFLGHLVDSQGIRPLEEKVQAIMDFPQPTSLRKLRDSLTSTTVLSRNVQTYSNHSMLSSPRLPTTPKNWPGLRLVSQPSWPSKKPWPQQPSSCIQSLMLQPV